MAEPPQNPLRAALVGCGQIAGFHLSALQRAGVTVVAVADRDEQKAAELAAWAGGAQVFTDARKLLAEARPDVVHVLTPPSSHAALAIMAAEAGAHVLVEKPIALSTDEADAMIAAARKHGVRLVPNHNYLFKPSVRRARELVDSGEIGDVVHVETYYGLSGEGSHSAHWEQRLPGGAFTNFLPHVVYLQDAFLGGIESVGGLVTAAARRTEPASELAVLVQGASATGVMTVSIRAQPYAKYVRIFGTKGLVHADLVGEIATVHRQRRLPRLLNKALFNLEVVPQLTVGTVVNSAKVVTGSMRNMPDLHEFVRELYTALAEGREPPTTEEDGRTVVAVVEQVWEQLAEHEQRRPRLPAPPPSRAPRTPVEERIAETGGIGSRVLVTGASGYVGKYVAAGLLRCGATVRALVRDASTMPPELEGAAEAAIGNLVDPDSLRSAMDGVDLVVHCAAVTTNSVPWWVHEQTNVEGTRAVRDAARAAGVRRLVHISSIAVYDAGSRSPVPESAPLPGNVNRWAYYQRSKIAAEQVVANGAGGGPEVVVVRPGIIYGPGRLPVPGEVQLGSTRVMIGSGRNNLPYVFIDDVVDGILLALTVQDAAGEVYNLAGAPDLDARSLAQRVGELKGETTRLLPLPVAPLNALARVLERRREEAGAEIPPQLSRFQIEQRVRDLRYDVSKARAELGWRPRVSLDEGLRRSLAPSQD